MSTPLSAGNKPGLPEILFFHTVSIDRYGGFEGVRDEGTLFAAIAWPWQASFRHEHFVSPFQKAAALMESIIRRPPFVDGNKRTGTASALYLLSTFGYEFEAEQKDLEDFVVNVALGELQTEEIAAWFENHAYKA
ncbi:MAG: type II toxin-antitoxin system death-on-curing family toxin [Actinomycetota bacterium]|nr:type II toxin-antitoxin system death-on-curing family toxin [Actinomycetota bacterium]